VMALAGVLLLIACSNVANLLLANGTARRREVAIRLAVGASRGRLVRQLLTEGLALAALAGAFGLGLAHWGAEVLVRFLPQGSIPIVLDFEIDVRVAGFTVAISLFTAMASALAPALQVSRPDLARAMAAAGPPARGGVKSHNALVIAQVAFAAVIGIGAFLFLRTAALLQADLGYVGDDVLMVSMKPVRDGDQYPDARLRALYGEIVRRAQELPGVASASMVAGTLGTFNRQAATVRVEKEDRTISMVQLRTDEVSPGSSFLSTMRLSLLVGRTFHDRDLSGPPVVIVSEALARDLFGHVNPLGRRIRIGERGEPAEIVGFVGSGRAALRDPSMRRFAFTPLGQRRYPTICTLLVRAGRLAPGDVIAAVRNEIRRLDKDLPVFNIRTAAAELDRVLTRERMLATLSGLFGGLSTLLVGIGLYGLVSHTVLRRRREIGIRMALGAGGPQVLREIVRESLGLACAGLAAGLPAAYAAARLVARELYGVTPADPAAFGVCIVVILAVTVAASLRPARRAAATDPLVVLRQE
jgi:predicted permease